MDNHKPATLAYNEGREAFLMRNFHNPYNEFTDRDNCVEWENGYNDARISTVYDRETARQAIIKDLYREFGK